MKKLYTIGYGDKDFDLFLDILDRAAIEQVVDVRQFPTSKWPEYRKENLQSRLEHRGIAYVHLEKLGGYRDQGYRSYMHSEDFREGLNALIRLAHEKMTVVMCLESYPFGCHRRFIAEKLRENGWTVIHLVGKTGKAQVDESADSGG